MPTSSPPFPFAFLNPPLAVVKARVPAGPPPPRLDSLEDEDARPPPPLPLPPRTDCPFLAFGSKAFRAGAPRLDDAVFAAAAAAAARGTGGARPPAVAAGSADASGLRRTRWRGLDLAGESVAAPVAVAAAVCWDDDDVVLLLSGQSDSCVANAGDMAEGERRVKCWYGRLRCTASLSMQVLHLAQEQSIAIASFR